MFGLPSLRIGKVFGIPVEVNATWLVIFFLVATSLSFTYYPAVFDWPPAVSVVMGTVTALLFFASILAHEMSHSLVARAGGLRINKVTLFLFGGVAEMAEEPHSPWREFTMAVAGPGMSLILAAVFFLGYVFTTFAGASDILWGPLQYLAMINLAVAVFNMVPGFPLDGGRVLRAFIWGVTGDLLKATLWASRLGQLVGYAMVAGAILGVLNGSLDFIWMGLVGWFLTVLADSAYRQQLAKAQLGEVRVSDIMTPSPTAVSANMTLEQLANDHFLGGRHSRYPVVDDGRIVGLISLSGAKSVPRGEWSGREVLDVADRDMARLLVDARAPADSVLGRLAGDAPGALLAVDDGRVVGIVTKTDVIRRLRTP